MGESVGRALEGGEAAPTESRLNSYGEMALHSGPIGADLTGGEMKRIVMAVLFCMSGMFLLAEDAQPYTLQQGTISLSGSSNIMFQYSSSGHDSTYSLSAQSGYFVRDNLELSLQLSGTVVSHLEIRYAVTPFVIYHIPLSEPSNLFAGAGAGYSWERDYMNGKNFDALLGWEYILTNNVTLQIKAQYVRLVEKYGSHYYRSTEITSQLGVGVYFK